MVHSPVTGGATKLIKNIDSKTIISLYKNEYNFDASRFFFDTPRIEWRQCVETGYEFYFPYSIQGDPEFYNDLYYHQSDEKSTEWAYSEFRFEFEWTKRRASLIGGRLLDIGAGSGVFLDRLKDTPLEKVGIETNSKAVAEAQRRGLTVYEETIEDHMTRHGSETYNIITAFQVLEHIYNVKDFISNCLELLAPGGTLIIAVPNNDGFIGKQELLTLNLPPHHMGRWSSDSLYEISLAFNMPLVALEKEPLQKINIGWYLSWAERNYLPKNKIAKLLYYNFGGRRSFERFVKENRNSISGHTIVAAYRKP